MTIGPAPMMRIEWRSVRLGIRGGLQLAQGLGDHDDDAIGVGEDVVVPEAQRAEAVRGEPGIAGCVGCAVGVLTAVKFDNESRFKASEVGDVWSDRALLAEEEAIELSAPQVFPKAYLCVSRQGTQFAGALECFCASSNLVARFFIVRGKTGESLPPP